MDPYKIVVYACLGYWRWEILSASRTIATGVERTEEEAAEKADRQKELIVSFLTFSGISI